MEKDITLSNAGRKVTMKDVAVIKEVVFTMGWICTNIFAYMLLNMKFPDEEHMKKIDKEMEHREEKLNKLFKKAEEEKKLLGR